MRAGRQTATNLMRDAGRFGIQTALEEGIVDMIIDEPSRKCVKKAIKKCGERSRNSIPGDISARFDAEAARFVRALGEPRAQLKIEKAAARSQQ